MPQPNERNDAGGARVTVACKIPHGIVLRGMVKREEYEAVLGGGTRKFDMWRWDGTEHEVKGPGPAIPVGTTPRSEVFCGYALTANVSKSLWDSWYEHNKDAPYCKNKLIFAYEQMDRVHGIAREHQKAVTGFEMIDPEDPGKKAQLKSITKGTRS